MSNFFDLRLANVHTLDVDNEKTKNTLKLSSNFRLEIVKQKRDYDIGVFLWILRNI